MDNPTITTTLIDDPLFEGRKKKKRAPLTPDLLTPSTSEENPFRAANDQNPQSDDYPYSFLLTRIYSMLGTETEEVPSKISVKPPALSRMGRKTSWVNFKDICSSLGRKPKEVSVYILSELAAPGSIDSSNRLIIKGKFQARQIESVLRHYIADFVTCTSCRSLETVIEKEKRIKFVCCTRCGGKRPVANLAALSTPFSTNKKRGA